MEIAQLPNVKLVRGAKRLGAIRARIEALKLAAAPVRLQITSQIICDELMICIFYLLAVYSITLTRFSFSSIVGWRLISSG